MNRLQQIEARMAEIRTQLGEHQHVMAYQLVESIARRIEQGLLELDTDVLLEIEGMTPDDIEVWVKEPKVALPPEDRS